MDSSRSGFGPVLLKVWSPDWQWIVWFNSVQTLNFIADYPVALLYSLSIKGDNENTYLKGILNIKFNINMYGPYKNTK